MAPATDGGASCILGSSKTSCTNTKKKDTPHSRVRAVPFFGKKHEVTLPATFTSPVSTNSSQTTLTSARSEDESADNGDAQRR